MTSNPTLNNYLVRLEKSLGQIPVSDKAEIVLEIKSHIDDAIVAGGELGQILSSLGEPESVANRYLLERGLQVQKAPKHPVVKWLTIGFLGTFAILCLSVVVVIWNFTPIIKVDEAEGRVQILGGLIDIQEKGGKVKFGNTHMEYDQENFKYKGSMPVKIDKKLSMYFSNANVNLAKSADDKFTWDCLLDQESMSKPNIQTRDKEVVFDLSNVEGADCKLEVPANLQAQVRGANGRVVVAKPTFNVDIELANGSVNFELESPKDYIFEFEVGNGSAPEGLLSQKTSRALLMRAKLINGNVEVSGL